MCNCIHRFSYESSLSYITPSFKHAYECNNSVTFNTIAKVVSRVPQMLNIKTHIKIKITRVQKKYFILEDAHYDDNISRSIIIPNIPNYALQSRVVSFPVMQFIQFLILEEFQAVEPDIHECDKNI